MGRAGEDGWERRYDAVVPLPQRPLDAVAHANIALWIAG